MRYSPCTVLIDIDNVIVYSAWREHLIADQGWDAFHSASINDDVVPATKCIIEALITTGHNIVLLTGRPEKFRQVTMEVLLRNNIFLHELLMRPNDDYRKSPEMKVALVQSAFPEPKEQIAFIIDDRLDIIEAFQAIGVPGFQAFVAHVR